MQWTTACPDWAEKLKSGQSIIPPPLFPAEAERALAVFRELRIVDAPGSPTFGQCCAPWVFDLVASIFGAYDPDSGRRLITEWFILIPKKNSKSTIAAGIMMTALILNWRESAEFSIIAPTVEVANNSYSPARDMVQRDDDLDALMHVQTHIKTIRHRVKEAILKVLAADSNTVGGKKSVGTLVDELWLFGSQANAANMLREATGGLASRPEGFVIYLTTQSDDAPAGVFKEKLQYARDVRDGKIHDPRFVPVIYEFPEDMIKAGQHLLPENFRLVNPNMGYSVDEEYIRREYEKAKASSAETMANFLAKHLNIEIGLALRSDRWAGAEFWQECADNSLTLDAVIDRSEVVTVGIDGGGLDDLLGMAVIGREKDTRRRLIWCHAWAHKIVLMRRKDIASRLEDFRKAGDLTLVEEPGDDVADVADIVQRINDAGLLPEKQGIGVDAAGIAQIVDELVTEQRGIKFEQIVAVSQGWKLNGAIKGTERDLAGGMIVHSGSDLMNWCVSNARITQHGNAISITKQASGSAKIDPLAAVFDAQSVMNLNPEAPGASVYNTQGVYFA